MVSHSSLPGMEQLDFYSPSMTTGSDLFLLEYEAQPRTLVDPRETTILAAPALSPGTTAAPATLQTAMTTNSQEVFRVATTAVSTPSQPTDTTRILDKLEQQHTHIQMLTHLWTMSAQSSLATQIFTLRDLLRNARAELTNLLDIYDTDAREVAEESERVVSIERKLAELEAEQDRLRSISGIAAAPPVSTLLP